MFLLRVQQAHHADDVVLAGPLNMQMAAFVPCCQPLGDMMLQSPRGWLMFLLRVQRAHHADDVLAGPLNMQMAALCHVASPWEII
ncbi:hypothetical protein ACN42_g6967 [Penicillium freii]|uniref:Uncharacterized protein n=1 Tax=Penicillium freii TaxID=48697 RepID=A0A101MGH9_PENFR|nr:hypothetical protein ACN42_g6967 [Penicillium freii]